MSGDIQANDSEVRCFKMVQMSLGSSCLGSPFNFVDKNA